MHTRRGQLKSVFLLSLRNSADLYCFIVPVPCSVMSMGNVTKYLQKLGMGVYKNENQQGVWKKIT